MINTKVQTSDGTLDYGYELAEFITTVDYFCKKLDENHLLKKDRDELVNHLRMFETIARH